jgi:hypothetical protein
MADVPDDSIPRGVEHMVERDGQFDDAETGAQMSASDRDRADRFRAQFLGKLSEIALSHLAQVIG